MNDLSVKQHLFYSLSNFKLEELIGLNMFWKTDSDLKLANCLMCHCVSGACEPGGLECRKCGERSRPGRSNSQGHTQCPAQGADEDQCGSGNHEH